MKLLIALTLTCIACLAQTSQTPLRSTRSPSAAAAPASDAPPPTVKPEDKCAVEGTVVNAITGEPLNKAHLTLRPLNQPNGVPYATTTDNAGRFLLDDIDPGRYSFLAVRNLFVNQSYSPDGNLKRSTTLTLGNGQKLKDIVFKLTPQGVITGRVFDQDGEALARVQVMCMTFAYRNGKRQTVPSGSASTNDLGEYRIFGLRPGKYVLAATYQAQQGMMQQERAVGSAQAVLAADDGYSITYYPNSTNPDGASRIEVTPGGQIQGMDMKLIHTRTYRLKGRLTSSLPNQSHRNVMLMLNSRDAGSVFFMNRRMTQVTDPKGTFEIRGVASGSYVITGYYQEDGVNYTASVPVDVGNASVEGIEVSLQPPAELPGHVVVEDNGDLKGANLNVYLQLKSLNPMMSGNSGPVKDDLTFKIANVGREAYDFNIFSLPEGFYLKSVRLGNQDVTFTGADFTQAAPAGELVIFINPNGAQVEGTVQNAKSENAVGAMVTLIPDESRRSASWLYKVATTDQNGHFSIKGIPPGEYKIYSWEEMEPGAYQDPEFVKPHESKGKSVSVKESGHETIQLTAVPAESTAAPK